MKSVTQKSKWSALLLTVASSIALLSSAYAGDVYLTGHDVLLHGGQNGYDAKIIDYLRGSDTKASYNIGIVGTANVGFAAFSGGSGFTGGAAYHSVALAGTVAGYGSVTFYDAATLAADAARGTILAGLGLLIVESNVDCGGCSLTDAGSAALNTMAGDIATAFNAGMDIWGQSGADLATYYGFLPAGAVATGTSISGSSGFNATVDGAGLGITSSMINGYPTHNRFTSIAPAFTVMETRGAEIISVGLKDGKIDDGGITTGRVPDSSSTLLLLGLTLSGFAIIRRKQSK